LFEKIVKKGSLHWKRENNITGCKIVDERMKME